MTQLQLRSGIRPDEPLVSALQHYLTIEQYLFEVAGRPDSPESVWAQLATLVAIDDFRFNSPSFQELDWGGYTAYLHQLARNATRQSTTSRIHQWHNLVYHEHAERLQFGDDIEICSALSVYAFNNAGKLQRISAYLQHSPTLGL